MVSPFDLVSPLTTEIVIGGAGGFLVGHTLKKVAKIIVVIIGLGLLGLSVLVSRGIVKANVTDLGRVVPGVQGQTFGLQVGLVDLFTHAPFGAAFIGGLYLGFKKE